jgi:hypothetical protein
MTLFLILLSVSGFGSDEDIIWATSELISFTVHVLVGSLEFSLASSSKVDMVL